MRPGWRICGLAALLMAASPAKAQYGAVPYGAPFGGSVMTSPEAAGSVYGAGAVQQQCTQSGSGRDGPRGLCLPGAQTPQQRR